MLGNRCQCHRSSEMFIIYWFGPCYSRCSTKTLTAQWPWVSSIGQNCSPSLAIVRSLNDWKLFLSGTKTLKRQTNHRPLALPSYRCVNAISIYSACVIDHHFHTIVLSSLYYHIIVSSIPTLNGGTAMNYAALFGFYLKCAFKKCFRITWTRFCFNHSEVLGQFYITKSRLIMKIHDED